MTWNVVGINFAHFHMGDNLRMVAEHPEAEIVGICDEDPETATLSLDDTAEEFDLSEEQVFEDYRECIAATDPDLAITCPTPVDHAEWVERIAGEGVNVLLEKPMAASVEDCERILDAVEEAGVTLAVNWPLAWYRTHRTTKRLIDEGRIGEVVEVHYYNGNRGGHRFVDVDYTDEGELHFMGDLEGGGPEENLGGDPPAEEAWWHRPEEGGGSLQDYLGYGTTLGTWFRDGELPVEVSAETFTPPHLEVDTHAIAVARYETGLSKYEARWGTYTDPWVDEPQPRTGFVLVGSEGTIASHDYADHVRVQDADHPEGVEIDLDELAPPRTGPIDYMVDRLESDAPVDFDLLHPELNRDAQRIVDAAAASAERGEAVRLDAEDR